MLEGVAFFVIANGQPNISLFGGRSAAKVDPDHGRSIGHGDIVRTKDDPPNYKDTLAAVARLVFLSGVFCLVFVWCVCLFFLSGVSFTVKRPTNL